MVGAAAEPDLAAVGLMWPAVSLRLGREWRVIAPFESTAPFIGHSPTKPSTRKHSTPALRPANREESPAALGKRPQLTALMASTKAVSAVYVAARIADARSFQRHIDLGILLEGRPAMMN